MITSYSSILQMFICLKGNLHFSLKEYGFLAIRRKKQHSYLSNLGSKVSDIDFNCSDSLKSVILTLTTLDALN